MKTGRSELQWAHRTRSLSDGGMARSRSQRRHLKCIMAVNGYWFRPIGLNLTPLMKPLLVLLFLAISVQAQPIVDHARQERERQAKLKPSLVIKETGNPPA